MQLSPNVYEELLQRRQALMDIVGPDSIVILNAAPERPRNRHLLHPYRQDSDFYYLTGFTEPEALMVLVPGREQAEYILFCRERDAEQETWNGRRMGIERAASWLGVDDAFPIGDVDDILPGLIEGRERVYYTIGKDPEFDQRVMSWVNKIRAQRRTGAHPPREFVALDPHIHEMRLHKSAVELSYLREAARISAQAHQRAMAVAHPGMMEYALEAEIIHEFRRHNAVNAYLPIVGGGENGCILHYNENDQALGKEDLVLIDSGAEFALYSADITRTFPVSGHFSAAQRDVYEIVLAANEAAIETLAPGRAWIDAHDASVSVITQGLIDLKLLHGDLDGLIEQGAYRRFYMHRVGHWLGLDTHDVGDYKVDNDWREWEPGMVTTIEPGLYITDDEDIPEPLRNIGVRIEDNLVITELGYENLTVDCPKSVIDIEEACRGDT